MGIPLLGRLLAVNFAERFGLFVDLPLLSVLLGVGLELFDLGHDLAHNREERSQDKVDEAWLTLANLRGLSIAEEGHGEAFLLLDVALVEELVEEQVGPIDGDFEGPGLSGDVGGVDGEFEKELLRVEFCLM